MKHTDEFKSQFYQLLTSRKSIRKYKSDPVADELVEKVVNAGFHAPSGKNRQNWRFIVIKGKKREAYLRHSQKAWLGIKEILEKKLKPSLYQFTERFFYTLGDAPVMIFCYSINDPEERYHTSIGSVYMALENMVLAANVEGLGVCPVGAVLEIKDEVNEFLGVKNFPVPKGAEMELLVGLTLGWPDHDPPKAARQTENRITWISE